MPISGASTRVSMYNPYDKFIHYKYSTCASTAALGQKFYNSPLSLVSGLFRVPSPHIQYRDVPISSKKQELRDNLILAVK